MQQRKKQPFDLGRRRAEWDRGFAEVTKRDASEKKPGPPPQYDWSAAEERTRAPSPTPPKSEPVREERPQAHAEAAPKPDRIEIAPAERWGAIGRVEVTQPKPAPK